MTLFVQHAPARRLRRAYRTYRSRPRLGGPLALGVVLAVSGHLLASAAGSATEPSGPPVLYRIHEPRYDHAAPLTAAAAPRVPARSSRTATRVAPPAPAPKPKPRPAARWVRPTRGPVTSPYGMRWGRMHRGLDFGAPYGAPVVAAYDGVVVHAGYGLSGYGRQVQIRHSNGAVTTYSHLSSIVATRGARVTAGQLVGKVGASGNVTGPHLHFEIHVGGAAVNPRSYLRERGLSL